MVWVITGTPAVLDAQTLSQNRQRYLDLCQSRSSTQYARTQSQACRNRSRYHRI